MTITLIKIRLTFVLTAPAPRCDVADSSAAAATRPPRGQYDFVDTASEHRMITSIEEVSLKISYQAQIDVVRGQRTAYEIEVHEVHQAYLSYVARNRALLARLETLETHMSRMEWQCQSVEDLANLMVRGNDVVAYTQPFQELALMCTKFIADETEKVDKYIRGLLDNIHRNVLSIRPKTLDDAIELANNVMDQKLCTYTERQNDNKRKSDDSSRNNQQQQPY
nr:hypothetical protein [Tanacetum cinerariifolium]